MKKTPWLIVIIGCALAGCAGIERTTSQTSDDLRESTRRILVTIPQSSSRAQQLGDPGSFYLRRRGYGASPEIDRTLDRIADDYDLRRIDGWHIASIDQYCEVYEIRGERSLAEVVERIGSDPRVAIAQPMNVFETQGVRYDDPLATLQPALSTLAIDEAHEIATGRGVAVAVIDSSVDRNHLEFRGRVPTHRDLVGSSGNATAEVHGTAVAGVIGSAANNGSGIVGVAPDSTIMSLRACWTIDAATGRAQCSSFSLAQALESAINLGADVINLSLAGPDDPLLTELIDAATENDIVVVAAAPTGIQEDRQFPSSHSAVIAVASSNASLEDLGRTILRAPGAEVMSTMPENRYGFFSGNSMSAAHVTGVSALVRELNPDISPNALREILIRTGTTQSVNACRAIASVAAETTSC